MAGISNGIITQDPQMLNILRTIPRIAMSDSTVLIQGETGTGKELVARAIHDCSGRSEEVYIAVNCSAIPEFLIESELFGHEKGAFTGASSRKLGKFELASGGTLLLDEISEMPPLCQAKVLRAIQEGEIDRVGGGSPVKVDIRIIATTNIDLFISVENGAFRKDLYFRLFVVPLFLPPLRERQDDILFLAEHFINIFGSKMGNPNIQLAVEAAKKLLQHSWPGNVRELRSCIERVVVLCDGDLINERDLFLREGFIDSQYIKIKFGMKMRDVEKEVILRTLEKMNGAQIETANLLGLDRKTIFNKLRKYAVGE